MSKQTHLVFGAGLIGSFVGGALHLKGVSVAFYGRGKALERLQKPLTLSSVDGGSVRIERLNVQRSNESDAMHSVRHYDVIWLTTKAVGVEEALSSLKPFVSRRSVIICCQNGIGSDEIVKDYFPDNTVLKAVVVFNVAEVSGDRLHRSTEGDLIVEHSEKLSPVLLESLNSQLCPIRSEQNIEGVVWAKLQLNLINAINAVANQPVKSMLRDHRFRRFYASMLAELPVVARKKNIKLERLLKVPAWIIPQLLRLPDFIYMKLESSVVKMDETAKTSMWWDVAEGRKTEIEFLQGALLDEASRLGVDCPYNHKVYMAIQALEAGHLDWSKASDKLLKSE